MASDGSSRRQRTFGGHQLAEYAARRSPRRRWPACDGSHRARPGRRPAGRWSLLVASSARVAGGLEGHSEAVAPGPGPGAGGVFRAVAAPVPAELPVDPDRHQRGSGRRAGPDVAHDRDRPARRARNEAARPARAAPGWQSRTCRRLLDGGRQCRAPRRHGSGPGAGLPSAVARRPRSRSGDRPRPPARAWPRRLAQDPLPDALPRRPSPCPRVFASPRPERLERLRSHPAAVGRLTARAIFG